MKRNVCILLLFCTIFSLISCGKIKYDEKTVIEKSKILIENSAILNEIYWGEGIGYDLDTSMSNGYYYPANLLSCSSYGITTLDDLKMLTAKTFSLEYSNSIFRASLLDTENSAGGYVLTRYYQKYSDLEQKNPECIMVYSKYEPMLKDKVEYLYDTLKVLNSDSEKIYISIDTNVTRDFETQKRNIRIALVLQNGEYRIDSPTYITFLEENK